MTMYNVDKSQVYVNMKGEGEAILFLHGVPDTSQVWDAAIGSFSDTYQCIAPDLPGFGRTQTIQCSNEKKYSYTELCSQPAKPMPSTQG